MDSLNLPQSLLSEIVTKKIPIPQSAGNGHYKKFSELYGTPESLIQYPLPRTSTQMANDRKKTQVAFQKQTKIESKTG